MSDTSYKTVTPADFAIFLIEEVDKVNQAGLGIMNTHEWIIQKWHKWAHGAGYPKPWPFALKPLLSYKFEFNSSNGKVIE